jgi:membrane-associated protein
MPASRHQRRAVGLWRESGITPGATVALAGAAGTAALLGLALALGVVDTPEFAGLLSDAADSLGGWTYALVPSLAFLETGAFVGLAVPGETAIIVGGVVAERGEVALAPLIGLVWVAAVGGDVVSFLLGRRFGRPFLDSHGARLRIRAEHVERVERIFEHHGGKAIVVGRFVGILRALMPFVAGASRFPLRRFVPYTAIGALGWAASFTLVGYGFSESFESAGEDATRIALVAALGAGVVMVALAIRSSRKRGRGAYEPQRDEGGQGAERRADEPAGEYVEREVHAQVDARERHGGSEAEGVGAHARADDRDGGGRGEGGGGVAGGERGVAGQRHEGPEAGIGLGRAVAVEQLLEGRDDQRGAQRRHERRQEGQREAAAPDVARETEPDEQRTLYPPRGQQHAQRRQERRLENRYGVHESAIELGELSNHDLGEGISTPRLLLVVNARASGIEDPQRTAADLVAHAQEHGADAEAVVTSTEDDLFEALRAGAATGRRVVLVGGDGSLHDAANAPIGRLPELALVPAGRANNIARALGIPTNRGDALRVAAEAPAQPLDALRVETPTDAVYALEALSAGFQAEARSGYDGKNSADLPQGVRALVRALRRFTPYRLRARLDGGELRSASAAQLFLSNLPYFGFGFEVDPGADPADGRFEAILIEAPRRLRLLRLLVAAYRGRHLGRPGVRRIPGRRAELTAPLPLVADAVPLGTTTAKVSVERGRLRVAAPMGAPA